MPYAEVETAGGDGYVDAYSEEAALGVRGHVVEPLKHMVVVRFVLAYHVVENLFHVAPYVGIGIFVYGQCTRCVLDKEVEHAYLW